MSDYRGLPLTDNRRHATITWTVTQDNIMHGFGGYFDSTLYADEMISIVPSTHSPGMISWFPVFIPIKVINNTKRRLCECKTKKLNVFNYCYRHLYVFAKVIQLRQHFGDVWIHAECGMNG